MKSLYTENDHKGMRLKTFEAKGERRLSPGFRNTALTGEVKITRNLLIGEGERE